MFSSIHFDHERAGIVRAVGSAVRDKNNRVGEPVLLSFRPRISGPNCKEGHPALCWNFIDANFTATRYTDRKPAARSLEGRPIGSHFFGHSSFAKLPYVVKYPYDDVENIYY
jgi:aryl-alcohol dehydrogenase